MAVKEMIETALGGLSEDSLFEVLDFVGFLKAKESGVAWFDGSPAWRLEYAESKADLQAGRVREFSSVEDLMTELAMGDEED